MQLSIKRYIRTADEQGHISQMAAIILIFVSRSNILSPNKFIDKIGKYPMR